ncbi:MAG: alpha/beta fold hydrolase [Candidatus Sericytochromatia bacterium]|nr:alpha/beta fold hydrolase [Candidatus Sericytochromatia bacterium]
MQTCYPGDEDLPLQVGCRGVILHPVGKSRGTVLAFHGFSAGPWQFEALAPRLVERGWRVILPRLAGHGHADASGREDPSLLPLAEESEAYRRGGDAAFALARRYEAPISLLGLSAGGAVALDLVQRQQDMSLRCCVLAPLLRPRDVRARWALRAADVTDRVTGGMAGRWLDQRPFAWGPAPPVHPDGWTRPGHWRFRAGNLVAVLKFARDILPRMSPSGHPLQMITTACDDLADPVAMGKLWRRAGHEKGGWLHFPRAARIPHAMISPRQNPDTNARREIEDAILAYLCEGTPTHHPPAGGRVLA